MFLEGDKTLKRKPVYGFGPYRLDVAKRRLFRENQPVSLTPKALEILVALVERGGDVIEKDELMRTVWPDTFVEEGNLTFNVSSLRKAFGSFDCIETIPRRGYRFSAEVRRLDTEPAAPPPALITVGRKPVPPQRISRRLLFGVLGALIVAGGFIGLGRVDRRSAGPKTLAVLPFKPLDSAQPDPILQLGLTDALITRFGSLSDVVVRQTGAVRRYSDPSSDPVAAGRELGVDFVLDGGFQREGDRVRVTARLIDIHTGRSVWGGQFDETRSRSGLFDLQDAVVERVAGGLAVKFSQAKTRHVPSPNVYDLCLNGRFAFLQSTEAGAVRATEYYEQAVKADPEYAVAFAGLATALMLQARWGTISPDQAMPRATTAVRRARALDDSLAETHLSSASISLGYDWDLDAARRECERAVSIAPNLAAAHTVYASVLTFQKRFEDAILERHMSIRLDPKEPLNLVMLGWPYYFSRRYEEAAASYRKAIAAYPEFPAAWWCFGETLEAQGKFPEAVEALRKSVDLSARSPRALAGLGHALGAAGRKPEALALLEEIEKRGASRHISPMFRAMIHAGVGNKDRAFAALDESLGERSDWMIQVALWPLFDSLRADPRFAALVERIRPAKSRL